MESKSKPIPIPSDKINTASGYAKKTATTSDIPLNDLPTEKFSTDVSNTVFVINTYNSLTKKIEELEFALSKQKEQNRKEIEKIGKGYKEEIDNLKKETPKILQSIKNLADRELRLFEALGIFFALFTFISINIQLFTRITDIYTGIIFGILIFFALTLMLIMFNFLLMYKDNLWFILRHLLLLGFFIFLAWNVLDKLENHNSKINPVENTQEFIDAIDKRLEEKNDSTYYNKDEIDDLLKELQLTISPIK